MKRKPKVDWTFFSMEHQDIFCKRCGARHPIAFPIEVDALARLTKGFNLMHADCPPPAKPEGDQP